MIFVIENTLALVLFINFVYAGSESRECFTLSREIGTCIPWTDCSIAPPTTTTSSSIKIVSQVHNRRNRSASEAHDNHSSGCSASEVCCPEDSVMAQNGPWEPTIRVVEGVNQTLFKDVCGSQNEGCSDDDSLDNTSTADNQSEIPQIALRSGPFAANDKLLKHFAKKSSSTVRPSEQSTKSSRDSELEILSKLFPTSCRTLLDPVKQIFEGIPSYRNEFPWMAKLLYRSYTRMSSLCAGSLITKRHILTAAHCIKSNLLKENNYTLVAARLGTWDSRFDPECSGPRAHQPPELDQKCSPRFIDVPISRQIAHESFIESRSSYANDIGLLQLDHEISYTNQIRPICLPTSADISPVLEAAGWGKTEQKESSDILLKVSLPLVDKEKCEEVYNLQKFSLNPGQLCAGGEGGRDTCFGDSGGPLTQLDQFNTHNIQAVGIISFGARKCGSKGWPTVFTKVHDYMSWIKRHLVRLSLKP